MTRTYISFSIDCDIKVTLMVRDLVSRDARKKTAWLCGFCHGAGKKPAKTRGYKMLDKVPWGCQTWPIETSLVT